jgi:hypothetical protein
MDETKGDAADDPASGRERAGQGRCCGIKPWSGRRVAAGLRPVSPLVEPSVNLGEQIVNDELEGVVLKDRTAPYRSGSRRGWSKLKAPDWHEKHRERFRRDGAR